MRGLADQDPSSFEARRTEIVRWITNEIARQLDISPEVLLPIERLSRYGIGSARAAALIERLSVWLGQPLSPTLVWEYPTIDALAAHLAGEAPVMRGAGGEALEGRIDESEPVAIVGMACRLPGDANSPEQFWALLREGVDVIRQVPEDRWNLAAYYNEDPASPGKMNTLWGGFLRRVDGFDPLFFGISPREAAQMDPQQRLMLELSWEALEDAGIVPPTLQGSRAGVFYGVLFTDYALLQSNLGPGSVTFYTSTGNAPCIVSNRISYAFGLEGPSMTVDTASSSSLVAVHLACHSLRNGECSMALAGGVNLMLDPVTTVGISKLGAMSPDGRCRAFDARANGYVRGEGGGVVVLKRLSHALRHGDPIYCVIRGSAVNNDGASNGLTAPNPKAQEAMLRDACRRAGVEPSSIHYVEAHGSGTPLGDPIEASALGAVYGRGRSADAPLLVGSVKTNMGHLEAAAGIAGLMKVALAIRHTTLPPSLHMDQPNPHIDFEGLRIEVVTSARPWPVRESEPLRAGISSFGYGGTNSHVIVEGLPRLPSLLLLGGESQEELNAEIRRSREALASGEASVLRMARASMPQRRATHRLAIVGRSSEELGRKLEECLENRSGQGVFHGVAEAPRDAVWVFSGQGSPWAGMGRSLIAAEPVFRAALGRCDRAMRPYLGWSVFDELAAGAYEDRLARIEVAWPVLCALQIALSELWRALGIEPAAVIGHSIGEVSAAYAAGALTLEESARVICHQARLVGRTDGEGAMVLVALGWGEAAARIAPYGQRITCAIASSPVATVLSGEPSAMRELVGQLRNEGTFARWVQTKAAVHGPRMSYLADDLPGLLETLHPRTARIPIVSAITGGLISGSELDTAYWSRQLCEPVRFAQGIRALLDMGHTLFLEVSPHPIVKHSIEECLTQGDVGGTVVASLVRGEDETTSLREGLGALYARGVNPREPREGEETSTEIEAGPQDGPTFILPVSAQVEPALREHARHLCDYVRRVDDVSLNDICFTASLHRTHYTCRSAVVARGRGEIVSALDAIADGRIHPAVVKGTASPGRSPRVVFAFAGQGPQWLGMGQTLFQKEPVFREAMERCDAAIRASAGWSLIEALYAEPSGSCLDQVEVIQPSLVAVQIALAAQWRSWGIEPDAVIGQSLGEISAAHVVGVLSLEDAMRVICTRSRLAKRRRGLGAMAVVELPSAALEHVLAPLKGQISIAAINGPTTTLLSGEADAVRELLERLSAEEVFCRQIKVDYASHSSQVEPLRDDMLRELSGVEPRTASVALLSTVTGRWIDGQEMNAAYWFQNERSPVLFFPGVQALLEEGYEVFLEISPHPALALSLQQAIRHVGKQAWVVASIHREQDALRTMLDGLATLHCLGHDVHFARLYPHGGRTAPLPTYPWQRERYWLEAPPASAALPRALRFQIAGAHPLLGVPFASSVNLSTRFWEAALSPEYLSYLADHRIQEAIVLPGTAYLEMALAAAREVFGAGTHTVEDVSLIEAMTFAAGEPRRVQVALSEELQGLVSFRISTLQAVGASSPKAAWTLHATGKIRRGMQDEAEPERDRRERAQASCRTEVSGEAHYKAMAARGLLYGPAFQGVQRIVRGEREALGLLRLREQEASGAATYQVHPALLDASVQMLVGLLPGRGEGGSEGPVGPVAAQRVRVHQPPGAEVWAHVTLSAPGDGGDDDGVASGDVVLFDASGRILVEVLGLQLKGLEQTSKERREERDEALLMLQWQRADPPEVPAGAQGGRWLLLADEGGMAEQIQSILKVHGASVTRIAPARDTGSVAALERALQEAFADRQPCRGVIHLGSLDTKGPLEPIAIEATETDSMRGWGSALALVQALARKSWRDAPRLWLVTRGAQAVGAEKAPVAVLQAPLWGLGRTIVYEHAELCCTRVDLSPGGFADEASWFVQELLSSHREEEIALRAEGRYVARLRRQALRKSIAGKLVISMNDERVHVVVPATERSHLSAEGTYLITGGLGGLGLSVGQWLIKQGARHLVLIGRKGATTPSQVEALDAMRAAGAQVSVVQVDVSDRAQLSEALGDIKRRMPPLRGVIHAAGVLEDGLLVQQNLEQFRRVMAPKMAGAMNLHALTQDQPLDFFVLYSSATSLLGSPGKGNYAAANASLDALAHHRRACGLPGLSINWGPFSEVGLAAAQGNRGTRLVQRGTGSLTLAEGEAFLERLLDSDLTQAGVVSLDARQWIEFYPAMASSSLFSTLMQESARQERGASALQQGFVGATPEQRGELMDKLVREQLGIMLRVEPSSIQRHTPLKSIGIDSLMGLDLRNRLESMLALRLPATLIWTYPDLASLVDYLGGRMGVDVAQPTDTPKRERREETPPLGPQEIPPRGCAVSSDATHQPLVAVGGHAPERRDRLDISRGPEPIAIVGMGCRFPGGISGPEAFWRLLQDGVDAIGEIPEERWTPRASSPERPEIRWAGLVDAIDGFDAAFFGIAPREAKSLDPQQRLLLEVTWEALEHAGQPLDALMGSRAGVFVGIIGLDYRERLISRGLEQLDAYAVTGNMLSTAAGRLSYTLGLQGPSLAIDSACSSSLVAVHLACQSLRSGESDWALAGGVNVILSPFMTEMLAQTQALAPDGRCKTFDARANGFVRAEGCGMIVLKRLSDAARDGDRVWALIRGSAVNQDGRSTGLTAPNVLSQQSLLRQALESARVSPAEVSYIEAHGTGTSLGDPIEVEALKAVLGHPRPDGSVCALGSVKTNLGHLEAAAGVAGLIKVVLSLNHELIPRHLHFRTLNPMIDLAGTPFVIPTNALPWKSNGSRRITGVSSFGISGTNAHVILEEAPQRAELVSATTEGPANAESRRASAESALPVLLPLSAKSPEALNALAQAYQDYLRQEDENAAPVQDITYTASVRRSHYEHRLAVLGSSRAEMAEALRAFLQKTSHPGLSWGQGRSGERPRVVFVFPGQGSQWRGMGRELLEQEPVFREALKACDEAFRQHASFSLLEELQAPEATSQLDRIDVIQPTLFAMGVGLSALWRSWGVQPDAVVGHSMGEVGAAYVAGALRLEDAARIICRRSQLLRTVSGKGAMAVVELTVAEATEKLRGYEDRLAVAVSNSPRSTVLSGDASALDELIGKLEAEQVFCRRVKVDVASHSPQMDPLREPLLEALSEVKPRRGQVPIYSTVSGRVSDGAEFDAAYWVSNLREPVQFGRAVEQLTQAGHSLFIEMSPHPILLPAIEQAFAQEGEVQRGAVVPSLRREKLERTVMLESLGALYAHGYPVDFRKLYTSRRRCVPLPTYPWERRRYWIEGSYGQAAPADGRSVEVQVLEREGVPQRAGQARLEDWFYELTWPEQPRGAVSAKQERPPSRWLVLTDQGGVGAALAARLEVAGDACTVVFTGGIERGDGRIESVLQASTPLTGVIYAGGLDAPSSEGLSLPALEAAEGTICESVLHLLTLLVQREQASRLWLVTRGAQPVGNEHVSVAQAPLWGLGRVIALEHPELWGALIDLDPKGGADELEHLAEAIRRPQREDQLALRGGLQHAPRLARKPISGAREPLVVREDSTYLITGGLGGLGRELARWLVRRGARHLLLTSRSGLPDRAQWTKEELSPAIRTRIEAVRELEALGAVVAVEAADAGDPIAMARAINASPRPLGGVIHAAGIGPLQRLVSADSLETLRSTFQAKVKGTWVLHELTRDLPLDFFLLFSSAASIWGGLGQGHYGAANQFLDAVAHYRRATGLPATSINWGLWADGEMATPELDEALRSIGLMPMPTDSALEAMERAAQEGDAQRIVAWVDFGVFKPIYEARGSRPLFEGISSGDITIAKDTAVSEMKRRLKETSASEGRRLLKELVTTNVARVLGFAEDQPPPPDKGFFTLGMDSIMAVQLMTALGKAIGQPLRTVLAFEHPTILSLTEHLATKVLCLAQSPQEGGREPADPRQAVSPQRTGQHIDEPIAVIGIGCRYPGHADGPDQFWRNLASGVDAISEIPPDRWDSDRWFDSDPNAPGKTYSRHGGFLTDVDRFDTLFFEIAPRDAVHMDPQHRILLEVAWEALEHAGQPPDKLMGSKTGVFLGITNNDYARILGELGEAIIDAYDMTGSCLNFAAGRLSYSLGLQGPCMAVDAACASSLVAAHLACQSLRNGECNLALACGVNLILTPYIHIVMCKAQALSSTGRCRTFDASADGFVRSEGCGVVVLKRLSDAIESRDPILAIIRSSAVNQDGSSSGLTVPNKHAQEALIRQVLSIAGVHPSEVSYVEAHGTGTTLGDPIEISAIGGALCAGRSSNNPLMVGSVKTNIGHAESAAGVAGLIKVVLSLQARAIPPHLHLQERNPHVTWEGLTIDIPTQLTPWSASRRIAGVSSFGGSGMIAHMILEEAPQPAEAASAMTEGPANAESRPAAERALSVLLPLSAKSPEALNALAQAYQGYLKQEDEKAVSLQDIAYTASVRRSHHEHRLAVLGSSRAEMVEALGAFLQKTSHPGLSWGQGRSGEWPRVVFVFPGQGSQWRGMGRQLLEQEPVFGEALKGCAEAFRQHASFSLLEELQAPEATSQLDRIDVIQPTLFAMGVALSALWRSWGVQPDAVVGHSMGEVGAAYVAGALSLEDAARIICRRSQLLRTVSGKGAMAVVELTVAEATEKLRGYEDRLAVAVSNSPRSTVLSGDASALDELIGKLEAEQVFCRRVKVDVASHSPQMDPLRDPLLEALSEVKPRRGQVPIYSTVSGQVSDGSEFDAAYWVNNLREPVQFGHAVEQLVQAGHSVFIEMSPHPILLPAIEPMLRGQAGEAGGVAVGSLRREQSERAMLLQSLGTVYSRGYPIDWRTLYPQACRCVPLPTYPWNRQRYWIEGASAQGASAPRLRARRPGGAGHPLMGELFTPAIQPGTRFWQTELRLEDVPYLSDHRVQEAAVLPGTAYVEMALSAAQQALGAATGVILEEMAFRQALVLREAEAVVLQVALTEEVPGRWSLQVSSRPVEDKDGARAEEWTLHVSCTVRIEKPDGSEAMAPSESIGAIQARCGTEVQQSAYYQELSEQGLVYGPAFQGVQQLWQGSREAVGRLRLSEEVARQADSYVLHPALLDAAFQVLGAAVGDELRAEQGPVVPVKLSCLRIHHRPGPEVWSHVRVQIGAEAQKEGAPTPTEGLEGDVVVRDASGKVLVEALGLRLQRLEQRAAGKGRAEQDDTFLTPTWEVAQGLPEPVTWPRGRWLLLGDETGVADAVQSLLEARGESVFRVAAASGKEAARASGVRVNPASPEAFESVLQEISRDGVPCRGVMHLWSLDLPCTEEPSLESMEAMRVQGCGSALHLVQALGRTGWRDMPRLWLITRGTQAVGPEPSPIAIAQAPLWGLGRTIVYERPELRCRRVDLAPVGFAEEADALVRELLTESHEEEIAFRSDGRYVGRLLRRPVGETRRESLAPAGDQPFRLEITEPGRLDRLTLRSAQRRQPGPGEVEIRVEAASLNFIDVMKTLGIYPGLPDGPVPLGGECSGHIVSLGEGVQGFRIGQDIVATAPFSFGTHVTISAAFVAPRPQRMSVEQAAAVSGVFMTSWYALYYLGRLQKGDRVLIHSAAGGVGLAAVQLARRVGAEIFATAGTPEKRAYLRELGIEHVMDSRSLQFAEQVMAATRGKGVDVVLNSLAGQAIEKSLSILANDGRFLELGKRDIYTDHRSLSLAFFRKRLSYHAVDLLGFAGEQPQRFSALLCEVLEAFEQGALQPLPVQIFPISEAEKAFRLMAQGHHTGKLVLTLDDPNARVAVPAEEASLLRADGSYLITGGLGGLGLSVARWMVEQGARHVALLGRRGPSEAQREAIEALEAAGAEVQVLQADISDPEQLASALRTIEDRAPLRGVVHAAAVLADGLLMQQDLERLRRVMAPKVEGALNLHRLTRDKALDFFVLYSSGASLLGSPGQGNYAAANTFLDALAHHRHAQGLPALSINWGPFSEVGLAAAQENRGVRLSNRGIRSLTPEAGVAILDRLLRSDVVQIAPLPIDMRQWVVFYPHTSSSPRMSHLMQGALGSESPEVGKTSLSESLRAAMPAERRALLEQFVREQVAGVVRLEPSLVDRQTPLKKFGIDSLMGLELRNRLEVGLGLTLSATLIWTYPNVVSLAEYFSEKLQISLVTENEEGPQEPRDTKDSQQERLDVLQQMSEEEKAVLLNKHLADVEDLLR